MGDFSILTQKKEFRNMQSDENRNEPPHLAEAPRSRNPFKLVLGILLALVPGISIVLILNILNRSGWFSLLSGLSGMLLYSVLVFVQWISGRSLGWRGSQNQNQNLEGPPTRQALLVQMCPVLLLYGLLGIAGAVGLFFIPDQQSPVFALISGALGLLLCISVFRFVMFIGISILVLFLAEKFERQSAFAIEEIGTEVDERAP